jgi:hypothetical protein
MKQKARTRTEAMRTRETRGEGARGKMRAAFWAAGRLVLLVALFILASCLLASCLLALSSQAQAPGPDPYEPDDPGTGDPPWIANDEVQQRSFYPEGDVDTARFRVKAGHWYDIHTQTLAPLVDTLLKVDVAGMVYEDDDGGAESLASRLTFQAAETTDALVTIATTQGVYSTTQTYELYAGEIPAPTPTPTNTPLPTDAPRPTDTPPPTPLPTSTPKPTHTPPPTATPAKPIISFSATPDRLEKPGDCVTLRWQVERASEVYLVHPNGNQEGVIGQDERQVCPLETSVYALKVYAPGGDETVEVQVSVAPPTATPTPKPAQAGGGGGTSGKKGTVHAVVFVDENRSEAYDPQEGVLGALVTLMSQADPGQLWTAATDEQGQAHFPKVPSGSYTLLIPHLGYAEAFSIAEGGTFRGEDLTLDVLVAPIQLPAVIP